MDWNNINKDKDTSGLGPIEYDQSKVPALIRKHADNVRTKTYGQEVREAQARNAEYAGLIAQEANDISKETETRQDTVEARYDVAVGAMTEDTEILDARVDDEGLTHLNLSERLISDLNKSFANTRDNLGRILVDVTWFGAKGDFNGDPLTSTDNVNAIKSAREFAIKTGSELYFPFGKYYMSETIVGYQNMRIRGAGKGVSSIHFPKGVDAVGFVTDSRYVEVSGITFRTESQVGISEENWLKASCFKFNLENAGAYIKFADVDVVNFYIGLEFKELLWCFTSDNIRFSTCGYGIYNHDCYTHTNIQQVYNAMYFNHSEFANVRASSIQAQFNTPNFGLTNQSAKMLILKDNANVIFNMPNFEKAYVSSGTDHAIEISGNANVQMVQPSLKDLYLADGASETSFLRWFGLKGTAKLEIKQPVIYNTTDKTIMIGTIYDRARVIGNRDLEGNQLWHLGMDETTFGGYRSKSISISSQKSAKSSNIVLRESPSASNDRYREVAFIATSRGILNSAKIMYLSPHASGYGEFEIFQIRNNSKIMLANIPVSNSSTVSQYQIIDLNMKNERFESGPVFVGGYGLGTVQGAFTYSE